MLGGPAADGHRSHLRGRGTPWSQTACFTARKVSVDSKLRSAPESSNKFATALALQLSSTGRGYGCTRGCRPKGAREQGGSGQKQAFAELNTKKKPESAAQPFDLVCCFLVAGTQFQANGRVRGTGRGRSVEERDDGGSRKKRRDGSRWNRQSAAVVMLKKREGEKADPKTWFQGSVRGDAPTVSIMKLAKPAVAERQGSNQGPHCALPCLASPGMAATASGSDCQPTQRPPIHCSECSDHTAGRAHPGPSPSVPGGPWLPSPVNQLQPSFLFSGVFHGLSCLHCQQRSASCAACAVEE